MLEEVKARLEKAKAAETKKQPLETM